MAEWGMHAQKGSLVASSFLSCIQSKEQNGGEESLFCVSRGVMVVSLKAEGLKSKTVLTEE